MCIRSIVYSTQITYCQGIIKVGRHAFMCIISIKKSRWIEKVQNMTCINACLYGVTDLRVIMLKYYNFVILPIEAIVLLNALLTNRVRPQSGRREESQIPDYLKIDMWPIYLANYCHYHRY